MNQLFLDYSRLARRTECAYEAPVARINPSVARLLHGALGLADEAAELAVAKGNNNLIEELGDLMWFVAIIADEIKFVPDYRSVGFGGAVAIHHAVGTISSKVKAHVFYGRKLDDVAIASSLQTIVDFVNFVSGFAGVDMRVVTKGNIQKLQVRYPQAFTEDKANNRDTDAEAQAVESH